MKNKFLLPFLFNFILFFAATNSYAQQLKEVIGWHRNFLDETESEKYLERKYHPEGWLLSEKYFMLNQGTSYMYDMQGRVLVDTTFGGEIIGITHYEYRPNMTVTTQKYHQNTVKNNIYTNEKGLVVEEKTFFNKELYHRVVKTYNAVDSLIGEMHYDYHDNTKQAKKRKVIHVYDKETKKKRQIISYNYDGSVQNMTTYQYYPESNDLREMVEMNETSSGTVTYKTNYEYKDGQLWKVIHTSNHPTWVYKSIEIYKDGKRIRDRNYMNDELEEVIDYQYVYYDL